MREWFQAQLAAGLPAFRGSSVSGTLAVRQEMVTELLAQWLAAANGGGDMPVPADTVRKIVKSVSVRAEPGTVLVDFTVSV